MSFLEIVDVSAGYQGGPDILTGISMSLQPDRSYCVIGPNGAGKSTLLKTIAGLLPLRRGYIRFQGREIGNLRPDQILRKGISLIPQEDSIFPRMSVEENLLMGAYLEPNRSARLERMGVALEKYPVLKGKLAQPAGTMSGGEQQMLSLARALMMDPKLVLVDEPSLGLAPRIVDEVFESIDGFRALNIAVLLVEQNVERGLEVSDTAFVLDLGSVRSTGPADQVLEAPEIQELFLGRVTDVDRNSSWVDRET